jgi:hypothetical protein
MPFWVVNIIEIANTVHQIVYEYRLCLMISVPVFKGR